MPVLGNVRKSVLLLAALVACHLVLISIQVPLGGERTLFGQILFAVSAPVQRVTAGAYTAVAETWRGFFGLRKVRAESQEIKKDIFLLRQENMFLRERLRFLQGEKAIQENLSAIRKTVLPARVIGVDAGNAFKSIVINKGYADGVQTNLAVCDRLGNLVGRIVAPVSRNESKVQLITDEDCGVSVISGTDRIVGVLSGDSRGGCRIKYVMAQTAGGREGEDLVTTGFDKLFPPGIRVARITSVAQDASLFKTIAAAPLFSFGDLDIVAVLKDKFEELF
jgi:rod shape-determining protein MreC